MFTYTKGCLFLHIDSEKIKPYLASIPESWQKKRQGRDGTEKFHITIIKPKEKHDKTFPENNDFTIVGLKKTDQVAFLVVHYPAGDKFRRNLGLSEHGFHITLGFPVADVHTIDKSVTCLEKSDFINTDFYKTKTIAPKQSRIMDHMKNCFPGNINV